MLYRLSCILMCAAISSIGQVYSPTLTKKGQVDATSLQSLTQGIYEQASAITPREKAEAIWRFFLTDARFVKPGFWYHIAGWAYEEPKGEVLDPVKLLNSYGFGLCYHIAPLLEAAFEAGGFADARVWFLTGHTVAEVFYDGAYHYFDSDMLGYNPIGSGPLKQRPVASVRQIEQDGQIILNKLAGPKQVDPGKADYPWYPADVRENAIPSLAALFTTTRDNWVFPFTRYAEGHTMDYTLRPGERIIRYFHPADDQKYFLPWVYDGATWREFPQEIETYKIKTSNGPRSQKDSRAWGTGRIEYRSPRFSGSNVVIDMPCPYVIIDAAFTLGVKLPASGSLTVETSTDFGQTWTLSARLTGPYEGPWRVEPATIAKSKNGTLNAVSGSYGYQVRFTSSQATITNLLLATEFQLNPRSIPQVTPGQNEFHFRSGTSQRTELPIRVDQYQRFAKSTMNTEKVTDHGQSFIRNQAHGPATVIFSVEAPGSEELAGFDAGGRFLDLRDGLAPDKLTAEVRRIAPWPAKTADVPAASISWSTGLGGPWQPIWTYNPKLTWKDGDAIDRTLRWPEVQKQVRSIPAGVRRIYVRYSFQSMAIDDFRLAYVRSNLRPASPVIVTHVWKENGTERRHIEQIPPDQLPKSYHLKIPDRAQIANEALIMECPSNASQQ
jgi:hypothetical protein